MATYHLTAKIGKKGMGEAHAAYIAREGKYSTGNRYEDLEHTASGNMPKWAEHNPAEFWRAADQNERANGSVYREIEIALPRELTPDQRRELVQEFIDNEIGESHAYQYAIHTPKAALEKGEQPHAHIMYSERIRDGIERDPEQYFKRYNAKNPEKGGAKKFSGGKSANELKAELLEQRERWATLQNAHLEKHGHDSRVDHRSLKDQGINEREPEKHLGGSGVRNTTAKNNLLELRAANVENLQVQAEVVPIVVEWRQAKEKAVRDAEELARIEQNKIEAAKDQAEQQRQVQAKIDKAAADKLKLMQDEQQAIKLIAIFAKQAREEWRTVETNKLLAEVKKLKDDAAQLTLKLQNSEAEKPRLFGRKEWEKNHAELESDVSYANRKARELEEGINWKLGMSENPNQFEYDGIQRLKKEHPDLYKARCDARDERQQEQEQQKQARKLEQQKDKGHYR